MRAAQEIIISTSPTGPLPASCAVNIGMQSSMASLWIMQVNRGRPMRLGQQPLIDTHRESSRVVSPHRNVESSAEPDLDVERAGEERLHGVHQVWWDVRHER